MDLFKITLIILFGFTVGYSILMSILTFDQKSLNTLPTIYKLGSNKKGKYHTTLITTTISSYLFILLFLLFIVRSDSILEEYKYQYYLFFGLLLLINITSSILFAIYSIEEKTFTKNKFKNLEYNYPFFVTLSYSILILILGSITVHNLRKNKVISF